MRKFTWIILIVLRARIKPGVPARDPGPGGSRGHGCGLAVVLLGAIVAAWAEESPDSRKCIFQSAGPQKPVDSVLAVAPGDPMPDFDLPAIDGGRVRLADYVGKKKLVISFVRRPGPRCVPDSGPDTTSPRRFSRPRTPHSWASAWTTCLPARLGDPDGRLWFPVASDFWPHGGLAGKLGILRPEGVSERAIFIVDEKGSSGP